MVACTRQELPEGTLRLVFATGVPETKAVVGDGNVADGGGIYIDSNTNTPDLVILIANHSGDIVATYPNGTGELEGTPLATSVSISFKGLSAGDYTVYAFGNTNGFWTMKSGNDVVSNLTALTSVSQVENLQFQPQGTDEDAHHCLKVLQGRLPLSAKGAVTLEASGNGKIELPLLRCVAKITARFENQFGSDLTLYHFSNTMKKMRPTAGYVVPHVNDFPVDPADASDLTSSETNLSISDGEAYEESWYVFPSIGPYTCDVQFSQTDGGDLLQYLNLPIHDDHARDITKLDRNQHLTITTRISAGKKVSFNFEVSDWDKKTERITFN